MENDQVVAESTPAEAVTSPAETAQQTEVAQPEQETQPSPVLPAGNPDVEIDERGVPWKNRAMEYQRKLDEVNNKFQTTLERLEKVGVQQQPQYTPEQLETFALTTDNPLHKEWAIKEKTRLQKEELGQIVKNEFSSWQKQEQEKAVKAQSFQYVAQRYPEAFKNGQWDGNNPIVQRIGALMQESDFANNPRGLMAAADIAYGQLMREQQAKMQQKQSNLTAQVKTLQKQTMVEGGGRQSVGKTPIQIAKEAVRRSGSVEDATLAMKEIFKARNKDN